MITDDDVMWGIEAIAPPMGWRVRRVSCVVVARDGRDCLVQLDEIRTEKDFQRVLDFITREIGSTAEVEKAAP